jgi:serine/threonine protein kinase
MDLMDPQRRLGLRKTKAFYFGNAQVITSTRPATTEPPKVRRLLRINFKNPKDDYTFVQELQSNQGTIVCHRRIRLHLAVIRQSFSSTPLQMLEMFGQIQHPNIADTLDVYFHEGKLCVVGEYLDISLFDLGFERLPPDECEIATIMREVSYYLFTIYLHD